ncbi:hypothetical protein RUND412_007257 [Rhizina undulata]
MSAIHKDEDCPLDFVPAPPPPKKRVRRSTAKGLRVKTGCITCRRRHLKCDEGKPSCKNCSKGSRACTYEPPSPPSSRTTSTTSSRPRRTSTTSNISTTSTCSTVLSPSLSSVNDINANPFGISPPLSHNAEEDLNLSHTASTKPYYSEPWSSPELWLSLAAANSISENPGLPGEDLEDGDGGVFDVLRGVSQPVSPTSTLASDGFAGNNNSNGGLMRMLSGHSLYRDRHIVEAEEEETESVKAGETGIALGLDPAEAVLFRNYVENVASWIDLFDPRQTFTHQVPQLSLYNPGLLTSILALSAKHTSRLNSSNINPHTSISYYNSTLHTLSTTFHPTLSPQLFATAILVSIYELLSSSLTDWHRHSRGVFSMLRSQGITGETPGLKGRAFWIWARQDVMTAIREGTKSRLHSEYWAPRKRLLELTGEERAERMLWLLAGAVNYKVDCVRMDGDRGVMEDLERRLEEWKTRAGFRPVAVMTGVDGRKAWWFNPGCYGVAVQMWWTAKVLLAECRLREQQISDEVSISWGIRETIREGVDAIIAIAASGLSEGCSIVAVNFGTHIEEPEDRAFAVKYCQSVQEKTGWEFEDLRQDLVSGWAVRSGFRAR